MNDLRCGPRGCAVVARPPLAAAAARGLAARLKALAHPARLRLLSLVAAHPRGEACVCHLVAAVGLSQPTVTHHLQALHRAGFLARERRGVWVWYRAAPAALAAALGDARAAAAGTGRRARGAARPCPPAARRNPGAGPRGG